MPEKTKQKKGDCENKAAETEKSSADEAQPNDAGNWSADQKEKSYYYDDDYGYEVYDPEADDDDDENC